MSGMITSIAAGEAETATSTREYAHLDRRACAALPLGH